MIKKSKKSTNWLPPKGSSSYFFAASDYAFKAQHPIGYGFLVLLGIVALLLPAVLYIVFVSPYNNSSPWLIVGWIGGFTVGIGLFNFVAIIIKQYLGHLVSLLSFVIGSILIWLSLVKIGII